MKVFDGSLTPKAPDDTQRQDLIEELSKALCCKSDAKRLHSALCKIRRRACNNNNQERAESPSLRLPFSKSSSEKHQASALSASPLGPLSTPRGSPVHLDIETSYLNALYYSLAALAFAENHQ